MNPFRLLVLAFRAAVRSEVDRAMADRRKALSAMPIDEAEARRIRTFLKGQGVAVRDSAEVLPFPANDLRHPETPTPAA